MTLQWLPVTQHFYVYTLTGSVAIKRIKGDTVSFPATRSSKAAGLQRYDRCHRLERQGAAVSRKAMVSELGPHGEPGQHGSLHADG